MVALPAGLVVVLCALLVTSATDWPDDCPLACDCDWRYSPLNVKKKYVECSDAGLTTIPDTLDPDIGVLILRRNVIPHLPKDAFKGVGLLDLREIIVQESGVREVHRDAFKDLKALTYIELSDNLIHTLHPGTFEDNSQLQYLYLYGNPITELQSGQFSALHHLTNLDLRDCQISTIHRDAFLNLSSLEILNLSGNRLQHISETVFLPVPKLIALVLYSNPWRCDCELRGFRNLVLKTWDTSYQRIHCETPTILKGKLWEDVEPLEFACPPTVTLNMTAVRQEAGGNATFRCQVRGDPEPVVSWLFNGTSIGNGSVNQDRVLSMEEEDGDVTTEKWTTLSLVGVSDADAGEYTCVARNLRGVAAASGTLLVPPLATSSVATTSPWPVWVVWLGVSATGVVLVAVLSAAARLRFQVVF